MANYSDILKKRLWDFYYKSRYYSVSFALWDFLWWVCFYIRPPFSWQLSTLAIRHKTAWLDRYIETHYHDVIQSFEQSGIEATSENKSRHCIWVFWGQGEAEMPVLIKACYKQLTSLNDNVILVTKQNLHEYVDIPREIYYKVESGKLTWAHFSDIIRTTLLAQHGGLWLDATVWVTRKFPFEDFEKMPFYSANGKVAVSNKSIRFWTSFEWNWSGWCLYAPHSNAKLFSFINEMLVKMAITEPYLVDYVLIDYLIYYTCRKFPQIGQSMTICNNIEFKHRGKLASLMNNTYDEDAYNILIQTDYIFKLSFRTKWNKYDSEGNPTFYGRLIHPDSTFL